MDDFEPNKSIMLNHGSFFSIVNPLKFSFICILALRLLG